MTTARRIGIAGTWIAAIAATIGCTIGGAEAGADAGADAGSASTAPPSTGRDAERTTQDRQDLLCACMNSSVDPAQDFFEHANGGWLLRNPIPPTESAWGIGNVVREQLFVSLRKINEDAAASDAPEGGDRRKIGDFWRTAIDEDLAERNGLAPLASELQLIDAVGGSGAASPPSSGHAAIGAAFRLRPVGVDGFFSFYVSQDEKKSDEMSVHLAQGGLGLPDRDFYFNAEEGVATIRKEYVAHLGRMLALLGRASASAEAAASAVMEFETALAAVSRPLEDLREPEKNYHRMTPAEATSKLTPSIDWTARLAEYGLRPAHVIVGQPEFFTGLEQLLGRTPAATLQDYLRLRLLDAYAAGLTKAIDDEHFAFHGRVLSGQKEQRERWKRVLDAEDSAMGMVLGRIFVQEYFPEPVKRRYASLVEAVRSAYRDRIDRLDWMSAATKEKAREKLAAMTVKVGYPDRWKDYSALKVGRDAYALNLKRAAEWRFNDMISKFGKPVDRTEWEMTPQTYNAYYNPSNNEIVLPAAIFTVPGRKDAELDDAVVYGYAGASTIGHEMTHGFDDEGRQFDARGNLANWWTEADVAEFKRRSDVMVAQFEAYEPLPGVRINGRASLGENLADYGGVLLGLEAFKKTEQYRRGEKIGGLTPLQRFFLGYALGWMHQEQEARLRRNLLSDVHAPAKWRVLGPLANVPEFHEAFGVREGCAMWRAPGDRVRVW
jgi:putative endopeptidase